MKLNYFENKINRAEEAKQHTRDMEKLFKEEITDSVKHVCEYEGIPEYTGEHEKVTKILLDKMDSVSAVFKYAEGKTAVLNFASFKNPGGKFLEGSSAQEESLCGESFLYNVLIRFKTSWYEKNANRLNRGLYQNRALYVPGVVFVKDGNTMVSGVITCASPNKSLMTRYFSFTEEENSAALESRIEMVLAMAADQRVDTLILGAFGCGVFAQDASEVAGIFRRFLDGKYSGVFSKVVFAVPQFSERDTNYAAFEKEFVTGC